MLYNQIAIMEALICLLSAINHPNAPTSDMIEKLRGQIKTSKEIMKIGK